MQNSTTIKIPKKYHHMIGDVFKDSEGYWLETKQGFWFENQETILNCNTQKEVLGNLQNIHSIN